MTPRRAAAAARLTHPASLQGLLAYGFALSLLLASALGFVLWRDYQGKLEAAEKQSAALSQGTAALIGFQLRNLDRAMRGIAADVSHVAATAPGAGPEVVQALVQGVDDRHDELVDVVLLDDQGRALTRGPGLAGQTGWFQDPSRQVGSDGLRLGPPHRVAGEWRLPLLRPLPPEAGGGWVMAELRLSALQSLMESLEVGPAGVAVLIQHDGTVLARSRDADRYVGQRYPEHPLLREALAPGSHGVSEETSVLDGVHRIRSFRALGDYPMVLAVGLARDDVLASWRPFVAVAVLACAMYVLGWLYLVRTLSAANQRQRALLEDNARSAAQLHEAQRIASVGSWSLDRERLRVEYSPEAKRIHGFPDDGQPVSMDAGFKAVHPDDLAKVEAWLARFREDALEPVESEFRLVHPDGKVRVVRARGTRVRDEDGRVRDAGTVLDITERARAEQAQAAAERQYRFMFDRNPLPFWVYRRDTMQFVAVNDAAVENYGYSREEFLGMTLLDIRPEADAEALKHAVRNPASDPGGQLWRHLRKDGSLIDVRIYAADIDFQGHACRLVLAEDVTDRLRVQQQIAHRANHDGLTDLPNRSAMLARLDTLLREAADQQQPVHVIYIDLHQFKLINDSLGHGVGDEVLKVVALRLQALGPGIEAARLGGDEFALAWRQDAGQPTADEVAARVQATLSEPVDVLDTLHYLSPSVGIASFPADGADAERLLRNAGLANHEAKRRGPAHPVHFVAAFERAVNERLQLVSRLHEAIERGEFELHFQAQYFASGREPVGLEALVRWRHPERGLVPPNEFIPVCEDSGLIVPLGRWVLREAARHHRLLADAGWSGLTIAVNVSAVQFQSGELVSDVEALMQEFQLPPGVLELELTESIVMDSPEAAIEVLEQLRQFGVLLSIDDFGTGYSSMAYLHRLPVDKLKIDRSFITDVENDSHNAAICESVLALARSFGLKVIAEGVETQSQLDWLRQRGCDEIQGFLLARPLPFAQVLENLRRPQR
ncbi:bifunctional diguanylate cyclase/phosphodiesterase [Arenimonas sp. MALMAid1274]|uniref:bifunctional diguanylate cyclase/phosphodiesterase n=1 Tax=Arenimonas sp. MALMAid1274 TaxID=3411630 RepID=UPI003BA1BAF0